MASVQQVTTEIKNLLDARRTGVPENARTLAAEYERLCTAINARLMRCDAYLARGLRSEALHYAAIEPNLFRDLPALEAFPMERWADFCRDNALAVAPPAMMDVGKRLREAATEEEPMRAVLRQHRKAALAQAPLTERIPLLRKLHKLDPKNEVWLKDLRVLEHARIKEIAAAAKQIAASTNLDEVQALLKELTDRHWQTKVPAEMVEAVRKVVSALQQERTLAELQVIAARMQEAHTATSLSDVKRQIKKFDDLVDARGVEVPAALMQETRAARDWAAEQDRRAEIESRFRAACTELEHALEMGADAIQIQALWEQARSFDLALPEALERAARNKMLAQELVQRRRMRNFVVIGALIILMAGGGVLMMIRGDLRERKANEEQQAIAEAIENYEFEQAQEIINRIAAERSALFDHPAFTTLSKRLDEARVKEMERSSKFAAAMEQVRQAGPEQPDRVALDTARELARTKDEQALVQIEATKIEQIEKMRQAQIDKAFAEGLQGIAQVLGTMRVSDYRSDREGFEKRLSDLEKRAGALVEAQGVSPAVRSGLDGILANLHAMRLFIRDQHDKSAGQQKLDRETESLVKLVENPVELGHRLKALSEEYRGQARAGAFGRVAARAPMWLAIQQWDIIADGWNNKLVPPRPQFLPLRVVAIEAYLKKYPQSPLADEIRSYLDYVSVASMALSEEGPWLGVLAKALADPMFDSKIQQVKATDGRIFYLSDIGAFRATLAGKVVNVLSDCDLDRTTRLEFKPSELGDPQPAAHLALTEKLKGMLEKLDLSNWEMFGVDAAQAILEARQVDPLIRLPLLRVVLSGVRSGGWGVGAVPGVEELDKIEIPPCVWVDPNKAGVDKLRAAAAEALRQIKPFQNVRQKIVARREHIFSRLQTDVEGYGLLLYDSRDWVLEVPPNMLLPGQDLQIVAEKGDGLRSIGSVDAGKTPVIKAGLLIGVDEGNLVFLTRTTGTTDNGK